MKKSFLLVLVFFVLFLIILLGTAFFAMIAENCMHMKVGEEFAFFNGAFFINCAIRYLPWCAVISLMMLVLYIIKHKFSIPQFIVPYYILALLVWMLVIPASSFLYSSMQSDYPIPVPDSENLSAGYFRADEEYLTYVTESFDDEGETWRRKVFPGRTNAGITGLYADSIIEESISIPFWGDYVYEKCMLLKRVCSSALEKGYFSYILFATMGFALSSVIFLCRFSTWRLVNAASVMFIFTLIIIVNVHFYDTAIIAKMPFFGTWWLPLVFNIVLCVLFMTIGIINWVRHPDRNREGQ